MKDNIKYVLVGTLMVVVSGLITYWSGEHDKQVEVASQKYEQCVKEQTHMTVLEYVDKHGEFPECK